MLKALFFIAAILLAAMKIAADDKPKADSSKKDGLSLTVTFDKKSYNANDEIVLRFTLKNEAKNDLFVGDGYLAPDYNEAGPYRHFEVHAKANGKQDLYFWCGMPTEGETAGIRKMFKLKPGEEYKGTIRLSAGAAKNEKRGDLPHEQRGGTFEDKATRKAHLFGKEAQKYSVALRYQVNPKSFGVWKPPADFKETALWTGELTSTPIEFEVAAK